MFRKILLILSGNAASAVILFLRTILIARLISVADYGIAATFLVVVMVTQLMSNLGIQKMIVQAIDGDDIRFQHALQGFQLLRGAVLAVAVFLVAAPMAGFLRNEELVWAYQALAVIPLFGALVHFDSQRMQRQMRFRPAVLVQLVPNALSVLLVVPLAWAFGDWRVMLFTILLTSAMRLAASHIVAERPFRLVFDPAIMRRCLSFGWPMLLNGVMLALVIQGEKLIVGRELGMAALAIFAMGTSLLQAPVSSAVGGLNQFLLPQLSAVQRDDAGFQRMAMVAVQANFLVGLGLALGVVALGEPVVLLALGPDYRPVVGLLVMFAAVEIVRSSRTCTSLVSLGRAKTGNGLASNLPRVLSLPVSWAALADGAGIETVLAIALGAEILGLGVGLAMMRWRARVALWPLAPTVAAFLIFVAALVGFGPPDGAPGIGPLTPAMATGLLAASAAALLASMTALWGYLYRRKMVSY